MNYPVRSVIVIGAGVSGLAFTHRLQEVVGEALALCAVGYFWSCKFQKYH